MKKIIMISGQSGHGKDATADILINRLDGECVKLSFAKYLKMYMKDYFGWDGITKDKTYREMAQMFGTDYIKYKLGMNNFHVDRICQDIKILAPFYDYFLIPDLRFKNEFHTIYADFPHDTISIRVIRLGFDNGLTEEQKNHSSETELFSYPHDYNIYTQSGIDHLEDEIDRTFKGNLY